MIRLSAADAISPAIHRTRDFLFRPFRLGSYLKLCLVAVLTEGLGGNGNFSGPGGHGHGSTSTHHSSFAGPIHWNADWIVVLAVAVVLVLVLGLLIAYLITRLRFAWFHCLIHNTREIRPGWHLYRDQAMRFFLLNVVVGLCFLFVLGLIALPFAAGFFRLYRQTQAGGHPDIGLILALVLPLIPIILLFVLVAVAVDLVLRDFMLPHFALEDATAAEAWHAVWARIATEKGGFFVYALLRLFLPVVAMIGIFIVLAIPAIIFIGMVVVLEIAIHAAFANAGALVAAAGWLFQVLIGVAAAVIAMLIGICIGGPLSTAVRQYALLFYGGRYQRLGDILSPPPPAPPAIPSAPEMA